MLYDNYVRGDMMQEAGDPGIFADMWAALIEKYSDRFMIGSDVVGHWANYPKEVGKYYLLLGKLTRETADRLCKKNVLSLIKQWR